MGNINMICFPIDFLKLYRMPRRGEWMKRKLGETIGGSDIEDGRWKKEFGS